MIKRIEETLLWVLLKNIFVWSEKGNQFDNKKWETKFPVKWLWIKEGQKPIFNVTLLDDFSRIQGQRNELAYDVGYCN